MHATAGSTVLRRMPAGKPLRGWTTRSAPESSVAHSHRDPGPSREPCPAQSAGCWARWTLPPAVPAGLASPRAVSFLEPPSPSAPGPAAAWARCATPSGGTALGCGRRLALPGWPLRPRPGAWLPDGQERRTANQPARGRQRPRARFATRVPDATPGRRRQCQPRQPERARRPPPARSTRRRNPRKAVPSGPAAEPGGRPVRARRPPIRPRRPVPG
jgi:hypothetical protein